MKSLLALAFGLVLASTATACAPAPGPPAKMSSSMASSNQTASCPRDSTVVGGGFEIAAEARRAGKIPTVVVNRPTETGWIVQCLEADGQPSGACKAYVLCATVLQ